MRIIAIMVVMLMIAMICVPVATKAQIDVASRETYVEFNPVYSLPGVVSNLLEPSEQSLEEAVIYAGLPEGVEGRYFGPYLESTLIQFHQVGGVIRFQSEFNFTSSIIMNGATQFWVRIPLDGQQYGRVNLSIEKLNGDGMAHTALDATAGYLCGPRWIYSRNDNEVRFLESGIYVLMRGIFEADRNYLFEVHAEVLSDSTPHRMYLTMEDYRRHHSWDYVQFYGNRTYDYVGEIQAYNYDLTLDIGFSWAFVFTNSLGYGLSSFRLPFGNEGSVYSYMVEDRMGIAGGMVSEYLHIRANPYHNASTSTSYISIYLPFESTNSVNWNITMVAVEGHWTDPANPAPSTFPEWISWWHNSTNNFLLASSYYYWNSTGANTGEIDIFLRPVNSADDSIPFYMTIPALDYTSYYTAYNEEYAFPFVRYYSNADNSTLADDFFWSLSYTLDDMYFNTWFSHLPLHIVVTNGDGMWANVTQCDFEWVYDLGWGKGYRYLGSTRLAFFLSDGTSRFYYDYELAEDYNTQKDQSFLEWLASIVMIIPGLIYDGLTWVYQQIKNIAEIIWANIVEFIGWIISMAVDVYNKVSDIMEGMLYGFPGIVILFLTSYVGNMLYTGRIPRIAKRYIRKKERRYSRAVRLAPKKGYRIVKKKILASKPHLVSKALSSEKRRDFADATSYKYASMRSQSKEKRRVGRLEFERRKAAMSPEERRYGRKKRRSR